MKQMNHTVIVMISGLFLILVTQFFSLRCSKSPNKPEPDDNKELEQQFQTLLNNTVAADAAIHNAVLIVDAPFRGLKWKGASGMANPTTALEMNVDDQFRIASIGKMTLATLTMKQVETGNLAMNDTIGQYLPESITNGLHVFQGKDYSKQITIGQLLSHTSGLQDYVLDGDENANGLPDFLELLIAQPNQFWTPEETIEYTKEHLPPLFAPGSGYHYSDTNYQLLGLILQTITGKSLHVLYREQLFNPLGMNSTYMEYYDNPVPSIPGRGLSHVFFGEYDYTDWVSNSADWAGGGLVSTTEDLNRFLRAFVTDDIFQNPQTKNQMLNWLSTGEAGTYYGLGVERINLSEFGMSALGDIYGHNGFAQSFMFYWPKQNVTIAGTLNQAISEAVHYQQLVLGIINLLEN